MLTFPDSFLDPDGTFRSTMTADNVPVLYFTLDGHRRCAACLNAVAAFLSPFTTEERAWRVVEHEFLYSGPTVTCDHCHTPVATLYGDRDDLPGVDDVF